MKLLRFIFYSIFKRYIRLELKYCTWKEADKILSEPNAMDESQDSFWRIAPEEDTNMPNLLGEPKVYIERVKRVRC